MYLDFNDGGFLEAEAFYASVRDSVRIILFVNPLHAMNPRVDADKEL